MGQESTERTAALGRLELMQLVVGRMAHALRTQVGVSHGVISDVQQGYTLSPEELADGSRALQTILSVLGDLRDVAATPQCSAEAVNLIVLAEHVQQRASAVPDLALSIAECETTVTVSVDTVMLVRALTAVLRYLAQRRPQKGRSIAVRMSVTTEPEPALVIRGPRLSGTLPERHLSLAELAAWDHGVQSIGLIYAAEVLAVNRVQSDVACTGDETAISLVFERG